MVSPSNHEPGSDYSKTFDGDIAMKRPAVYILRCSDGSLYTGATSNLEQRLEQHRNRTFDGYTASRLPVELVFQQNFASMRSAVEAERQIKGWSHVKKEALIRGDFDALVELAKPPGRRRFRGPAHGSTGSP
jgi:predicted GIY-YIG superfamily endonuclease